jgi:glutathione S-transferase
LTERLESPTIGAPEIPGAQGETMSLTFYYAPMSTASLTELVLDELGVPCDRVKLDLQAGDTKKADYLAVNPNGKVPCIVHDGTAIWESAAITMYLGEVFGVERKLYPASSPRRGEAMKWIVWTNVTLGESAARFTRHTTHWYPDDEKSAKAGESARRDVDHNLRILDQALAGKQYLIGDYTLVDAHVASIVSYLQMLKIDLAPFTNITAWLGRCAARPAFKKLIAATAG